MTAEDDKPAVSTAVLFTGMEVRMAQKIPERLLWAVSKLDVKPNDRLLEIGCGQGIAAALICERLTGGEMIGIDRSTAMIKAAQNRNKEHLASGKAQFHTVDLKDADLGRARFNKVFAVNVNVFWQQPLEELAVVEKLVAPGGSLYLFYQPPTAEKVRTIAVALKSNLQQSRFSILDQRVEELQSSAAFYLIAKQYDGEIE